MSQQITSQVSQFYNQYPFPLAPVVIQDDSRLPLLNFWGRFTPKQYLSENSRVLVAGCGTNEAISMALSLPKSEIIAIDLSLTSLDISKKIAQQFGLANLQFYQADILNLPPLESFDFISSFGVLHHLNDPQRGLNNLRALLKPNGMMELMFYSEAHRYFIEKIQKIVTLLAGEDQGFENKFQIAKNFIESTTKNSWPYGVYVDISQVRDLAERNPQVFADTFVHPHEVCYDFPGLQTLLQRSNLQRINFSHPMEWEVNLIPYNNPILGDCFAALPRETQYEIVDMINGPLYILLARPLNSKLAPLHLDDDNFLFQSKPMKRRAIEHRLGKDFQRAQVSNLKINISPCDSDANFVQIEYAGQKTIDNKLIAEIPDLVDGQKTGAEIMQILVERYQAPVDVMRPTFLHLIRVLIRMKVLVLDIPA